MAMVVYQGPPTAEQAVSSSTALRLREPESTASNRQSFVGLSNQGATCYLNGLLQTLFMTPEFRKAIFSWNYDPEKDGQEEWCIPLQLQRLFGMLQLSKAQAIDTVALTHSFGWEGTEVFQQQDVQELARVLFDALEDSFRDTPMAHFIDELYAGELIDYIRCLDVDYQSERRDKFLDFALAIVPFGSEIPLRNLSECIEMYLRPEILDGENQYFAEKYNRKSDAIKGLKFGRLPEIMSIQLKRFVYDWTGPTIVQKKLNDVVKFPMILDMNKYVSSKRTTRRSLEKSNDDEADVIDDIEEIEEVNNEFEIFLQKQIERLKSERVQVEDISYGDEVTTAASWSSASSAAPSNNRSPANGSDINGEGGDKDDPETAGEMSTVDGAPTSPQSHGSCHHERRKRADSTVEDADEGVIYESLSVDQIQSLLDYHGEWIYELYAVLIHSGAGIQYGHYYAYIKDLNTKQWWNFNDSSVTPVDESTVQEAWGAKNLPTGSVYGTSIHTSASTYYGGGSHYYGGSIGGSGGSVYSSFTSSNANAYMLMYKKISSVDSFAAASKNDESRPLVSDDLVPTYIIEAVKAEEEKREAKRREEEEMRNKLNIRVYWQNVEYSIPSKRHATYKDLLKTIWEQLDLKTHLREIIPKYLRSKILAAMKEGEEENEVKQKSLGADVAPTLDTVVSTSVEQQGYIMGAESTDIETTLDQSGTASTASNSSLTAATTTLDADDVQIEIDKDVEETFDVSSCTMQPKTSLSSNLTAEQEIDSTEPCYDLFRLRNYNHYTQLKTDVYDVESSGMKDLQELQFNDYRSYVVETRSADEEWEVFYVDGISLLIVEFDKKTCTFKEPRNIRMKKFATVMDLKYRVSKWVSYSAEHVRIMKITNYGFNDAKVDIIDRDNARLREDLSIYEGYKLYCEEICDSDFEEKKNSMIYDAYLVQRNSIEVRYNRPQEDAFNNLLKVDARWTVTQLRTEIAKCLSLPADEVRLFKQSIRGQELKDGITSLTADGVYTGMSIAVSQGKAAPAGHYNILFMEYVAPDNRAGAIVLPALEPEVEEVTVSDAYAIGSGVDDDCDDGIKESNCISATAAVVLSDEESASTNMFGMVAGSSCFNPLVPQPDPLDTIDIDDDQPTSANTGVAVAQASAASKVDAEIGVAPGFSIGDYDFDDALETLSNQGVADVNENLNEEDNFYSDAYDDFFDNVSNIRTDEAGFIVEGDDKYPSCTSTAGRNSPATDVYDAVHDTYLDASTLEIATNSCMDTSAIYTSTTTTAPTMRPSIPEHPYAPILTDDYKNSSVAADAVATSSSSIPGGASTCTTTAAAIDDPINDKENVLKACYDTSVEPSAFGQLMVRNCNPVTSYKNVEGLNGLFLQSKTTVNTVKQMLLDKLIEVGHVPADTSVRRIRIRDKVGCNPGRILTGDRPLQENSVYLFDNKCLAFQILEQDEDELPEFEQGNVVVLVQQWQRSTWSLGDRFEVLLRGSQTVRDISRGLSMLTGIPLDSLRAMVIPKETEFYLSELSQKSPSRNYGRSWFDPTKELRLLRFMSHEMRVQDGDVLLLQNIDEPLMELSPADLKSIQIVEAAANSNNFIDFWGPSDDAETTATNATTKTVKFSGQPSVGITIKTLKDRLKEDNGKNNESANGNDGEAATGAEDLSTEIVEFQKQGGLALFEDIA